MKTVISFLLISAISANVYASHYGQYQIDYGTRENDWHSQSIDVNNPPKQDDQKDNQQGCY